MVRPLVEYSDRKMLLVMSLDVVLMPIALEIDAVGSINVCGVDMREIFIMEVYMDYIEQQMESR